MSRGYNALGDVIKKTVDGRDLNNLWDEFQQTIALRNAQRDAIMNLFTFPTTLAADEVLQGQTGDDFEEASEYGEPKSFRAPSTTLKMGFGFKWYDAATRFTWKYLAEASASQIESVHSAALDADNRLVWRLVMNGLLTKTSIATRPVNEDGVPIFALYDGDTDATPPDFAGQSFAAGHQHYLTSGATVIDGTDLKDVIKHVTHHGFGIGDGSRVIILCHPTEADTIRGLRVTGGAPFDFIASSDAPAYLTTLHVVGQQPPTELHGLKIIGSYGNALVVEDFFVPEGYVVAVATGGPGSALNPLGWREHKRPEFRGLRQIGGNSKDYPLVDAFYSRAGGVGVRQRGAAAVMQVTAGSYESPNL